jgi:hypothetical protein
MFSKDYCAAGKRLKRTGNLSYSINVINVSVCNLVGFTKNEFQLTITKMFSVKRNCCYRTYAQATNNSFVCSSISTFFNITIT